MDELLQLRNLVAEGQWAEAAQAVRSPLGVAYLNSRLQRAPAQQIVLSSLGESWGNGEGWCSGEGWCGGYGYGDGWGDGLSEGYGYGDGWGGGKGRGDGEVWDAR